MTGKSITTISPAARSEDLRSMDKGEKIDIKRFTKADAANIEAIMIMRRPIGRTNIAPDFL
jgi:hypothetical protein